MELVLLYLSPFSRLMLLIPISPTLLRYWVEKWILLIMPLAHNDSITQCYSVPRNKRLQTHIWMKLTGQGTYSIGRTEASYRWPLKTYWRSSRKFVRKYSHSMDDMGCVLNASFLIIFTRRSLDFLYLRIDFTNQCNVGYVNLPFSYVGLS